jgi:hypothetical protein
MRRKLAVTTLLTSLVLTASPALAAPLALPAEPGVRLEGPRNAALVYWRVWDMLPREGWTKAQEEYSRDPAWAPSADLSKVLVENQGAVTKAISASRLPECDWGLDYQDGVGMLMPHLGKMRGMGRLLLADARRLLAAGDTAGAAERIAACVRLSRHCRGDGVLISSLVSNAIATAAVGEADVLVAHPKVSSDDRGVILAAIESLDAQDPFNIAGALEAEGRVFLGAVERELTGPAGPQGAFDRLGLVDSTDRVKADAAVIELMTREQIMDEVARVREEYRQAVENLSLPDDAPAVREQLDRIDAGKAGPLARIMMPNLKKIRESTARGEGELARARAMLK